MFRRFSEGFTVDAPEEVKSFLELLKIAAKPDEYKALVIKTFSKEPNFEARQRLLLAGFFSRVDIFALMRSVAPDARAGIHVVSAILSLLKDWSLIVDCNIGAGNQIVEFRWSPSLIGLFITLNVLDNVLLGRSYVAQKYTRSAPAILVEKDGKEYIGTGFIAADAEKRFLITAGHNVDPKQGVSFLRFETVDDVKITCLQSNWILHQTLDLAIMPISTSGHYSPIHLIAPLDVLSKTISLGYPKISTADRPYLLAHGGELNAIVTSYLDRHEYLIISNNVAPGNSGGPVLNEAGLCLGMVIRSLEGDYEDGSGKANAAIANLDILSFLQQNR